MTNIIPSLEKIYGKKFAITETVQSFRSTITFCETEDGPVVIKSYRDYTGQKAKRLDTIFDLLHNIRRKHAGLEYMLLPIQTKERDAQHSQSTVFKPGVYAVTETSLEDLVEYVHFIEPRVYETKPEINLPTIEAHAELVGRFHADVSLASGINPELIGNLNWLELQPKPTIPHFSFLEFEYRAPSVGEAVDKYFLEHRLFDYFDRLGKAVFEHFAERDFPIFRLLPTIGDPNPGNFLHTTKGMLITDVERLAFKSPLSDVFYGGASHSLNYAYFREPFSRNPFDFSQGEPLRREQFLAFMRGYLRGTPVSERELALFQDYTRAECITTVHQYMEKRYLGGVRRDINLVFNVLNVIFSFEKNFNPSFSEI